MSQGQGGSQFKKPGMPTTGGLDPNPALPPQLAGTGGVKSAAGPYGPPGFIGSSSGNTLPTAPAPGMLPNGQPAPGTAAWFQSPQGMAAQWQTGVASSPFTGLMPNGGQMPGGAAAKYGVNPNAGAVQNPNYVSPGSIRNSGWDAAANASQAPYWQRAGWPSEEAYKKASMDGYYAALASKGLTPPTGNGGSGPFGG